MKARPLVLAALAALLAAVIGPVVGGNRARAAPLGQVPLPVPSVSGGPGPGLPTPSPPDLPLPVILGVDSPIRYDRPFVIDTPSAPTVTRVTLAFDGRPGQGPPPVGLLILSREIDTLTVAPPTQAAAPAGPYLVTISEKVLGQLITSLPWKVVVGASAPGGAPTPGGPGASPTGQGSQSTPPSRSSPGVRPGGGSGGTSPSGTNGRPRAEGSRSTQPGAVRASPAENRSPLGRLPWMPLALLVALVATALGLKRIS